MPGVKHTQPFISGVCEKSAIFVTKECRANNGKQRLSPDKHHEQTMRKETLGKEVKVHQGRE